MRYRRTTFREDGTKHVQEVDISREEVAIRAPGHNSNHGIYVLVNGWNIVAARAQHGPRYVYTVVETTE